MHTVWSMQKSARPGLAILVMTLIFVVTLGVAAGFVSLRARAEAIELGPPVAARGSAVTLRTPRDWRPFDSRRLSSFRSAPLLALREPSSEGEDDGRLLLVFDAGKTPFDPGAAAAACLRLLDGWAAPISRPEVGDGIAVGELLGWQLSGAVVEGARVPRRWSWRAAVTVDPMDNAMAVILLRPGDASRRDARLLRQVCETVGWEGIEISGIGGGHFEQGGLRFDAPAGARFVQPAHTRVGSMLLAAGPDDDYPWQIEVYRSWLPEGEDPVELYRKMLVELHWSFDAGAGRITEMSFGPNAAWYSSARREGDMVDDRWLLRTPDGQLAWLRGVALADHRAPGRLREVLRHVAKTFRADPPHFDFAAARQRGADLLAQLGRDGLAHWWGREDGDQWLLAGDPASYLVRACHEHRRVTDEDGGTELTADGGRYIGTSTDNVFIRGANAPELIYRVVADYSLSQDLGAFQYEYRLERPGRAGTNVRVDEDAVAAHRALRRTVTMGGRTETAELARPDNYCPDPLIDLVAFLAVQSGDASEPAILATTGFDPHRLDWLKVTPLGERSVRIDGGEVPAVGARLEGAIDGLKLDIWFSRNAEVLRAVLRVRRGHDIRTLRRSTQQRVRELLPRFGEMVQQRS